MLEFLILAGVAWAGATGAPGWWVLLGALAMTTTAWWRKIRLLRQHPAVPFSTKMTTYFVLSTVINFGFAAAGYLLGALLRLWLSG